MLYITKFEKLPEPELSGCYNVDPKIENRLVSLFHALQDATPNDRIWIKMFRSVFEYCKNALKLQFSTRLVVITNCSLNCSIYLENETYKLSNCICLRACASVCSTPQAGITGAIDLKFRG